MALKPYQVWVKIGGEWHMPYSTHCAPCADAFAKHNVTHGNNVERIEVRDLTGVLRTEYDKDWVYRG